MSFGVFVFLFRFFDKAGRGAGGITNVVVNVLVGRMLVYTYVFAVFLSVRTTCNIIWRFQCPSYGPCDTHRFGPTNESGVEDTSTSDPSASSASDCHSDPAMAYETARRGHFRLVYPPPKTLRPLYKRIDSLCTRICTRIQSVARSKKRRPRPRIEILPDAVLGHGEQHSKPRRLIKVVSENASDSGLLSEISLKPSVSGRPGEAATSSDTDGEMSGEEINISNHVQNGDAVDAHTVSASAKKSNVCLLQ